MGAKGLWEVLGENAAERRSLLNLSTIRGFQTNNRGLRTFVVGIDISIQIAAINRRQFHGGQATVLRTFFFKLCNLQKAAITPVFVFDGPRRPAMKRGKKVTHESFPFTAALKKLIKLFGFYSYEAPGEADAELGQLNKLGFIDAVITEDSDVLVFGATCVIHTIGPKVEQEAHVFDAASIASAPLYLDEDGLLLIVLMAGGDYNQGIPKCGAKIAHALAKHGSGRELRQILTSFSGSLLDQHLAAWRDSIRTELRTNSSGLLDSRQPKLADNIPDSFPDPRIVQLYLDPLTSWSSRFDGNAPDVSLWVPREPALREISEFCIEQLGWNAIDGLKKRFTSLMWPGVAFRMISSRLVMYNRAQKTFLTPSGNGRFVKVSRKAHSDNGTPAMDIMRIRVSSSNFNKLAGFPAPGNAAAEGCQESILVTIPRSIFAIATRDLSAESTGFSTYNVSSDSESDVELSPDSEEDLDGDEQRLIAVSGTSGKPADIMDVEEEELLSAHRALKEQGVIDLTGDDA